MKLFIKTYIYLLLAALGVVATGCRDDLRMPGGEPVVEGEAATIDVKLSIDDVSHYTRAGADTKIESLWVGVFNVNTKKKTFSGEITGDNKYPGDEEENFPYELKGVKCESGESYIVAVANYKDVKALTLSDRTEKDLPEILKNVENWDQFREIIFRRVTVGSGGDLSVSLPTFGMPMSGSFRNFDNDGNVSHDHNDKIDPVTIYPGKNELKGAIHLRRILAHNTLNIQKTGDIVDLEVIDIEVFNLPKYTWMHSRTPEEVTENNYIEWANAGDAMHPDGEAVNNDEYYPTSLRYTPPAEISHTNGVYTFDFYQFENKRTGIVPESDINAIINDENKTADEKKSALYALREREYKNGDTEPNPGFNKSIYRSLSPEAGDLNNNATYVKIKALVTYKDTENGLNNPTPTPGITYTDLGQQGDVKTRMAEATYVVHLGHAKPTAGTEEPSALELVNDFNCRRNAQYTYNIKVEKVNKIIVEAYKDGERQPGAEGIVTDVTEQMFDLDAHFGVFSIELSKQELESFTFSMRTYENGTAYDLHYFGENDKSDFDQIDKKYYDWIEIVPQEDDNLASYPGYGKEGIYYLHQLRNYATNLAAGESKKFTVFVNEYTYEQRNPDGTRYGVESPETENSPVAWKSYVNQPSRQAWFNVSMAESSDKESIYFKSKYSVRQKSIQTYYEFGAGATCDNALGLEHENESFGMNLRWTSAVTQTGLSADNGRYNVGLKLGIINNASVSWDSFINPAQLQEVNEITNTAQTRVAGMTKELAARTYYVPQQNLLTTGLGGTPGTYNGSAAPDLDPQSGNDAQFIQIMYACLNRNRDEDGDGVIDRAELKWYVPASGKYLRMIIGRNSLYTPLMDYQNAKVMDGRNNGDVNTMYHFVSSDGKKIWVDEGMSSSNFLGGGDWAHSPWNIRCIRNLGTDLTQIINEERIEPAYRGEIDEETKGGVVKVLHYYGTALRDPVITPLPMHKTSAPENKLGRYGFEISPASSQDSDGFHSENNNTITDEQYKNIVDYVASPTVCNNLNTTTGRKGWRIPNQKEIVIMMRLDVFSTGYRFLTCTQEHWALLGDNAGNSGTLDRNYRLCTIELTNDSRIAVANWGQIGAIRCVRDLTADEANKSYSQISGTTN